MFQTSGITTGTFPILTIQNSDGTIAYLTDLDTKVDTTIFDTYTGTTAPNTFVDWTTFDGYTGNTLTLLNNKIDIVTGATGNVSIFLADGNLEDSGYNISQLTGGTTGGTGITGATNGLTRVGDDVLLGGLLTQDTIISGITFDLNVNVQDITLQSTGFIDIVDTEGNNINIETDGGSIDFIGNTAFSVEVNKISLSETGMTITDGRGTPVGIEYTGDYSTNYTARSLIDNAYLTGYTATTNTCLTGIENDITELSGITSISLTGATNGLCTSNGRDVTLGGTLSQNTVISGLTEDFTINTETITLQTVGLGGIDIVDTNAGNIYIESEAGDVVLIGSTSLGVDVNKISLSETGMTITDGRGTPVGIEYAGDYSGNFNVDSLVTKKYVDSTGISGVTNLGTGTTIGGTSGQDITLKSISVSGGMTISGDTNNIILSSIDPTGSTVSWGSVTGTLSNQTDLQNALDGKVDNVIFTGYTASTEQKIDYLSGQSFVNYNSTTDIYELDPTNDGQIIKLGIDTSIPATNDSISDIIKLNPKVFYLFPSSGITGIGSANLAKSSDLNIGTVYGVSATSGLTGNTFKLQTYGGLLDVNTSMWESGAQLYVDETTAGEMTDVRPSGNVWLIGKVGQSHATNGNIFINVLGGVVTTSDLLPESYDSVIFTADKTTTGVGTFFDACYNSVGTVASDSIWVTGATCNTGALPGDFDLLGKVQTTSVSVETGEYFGQLYVDTDDSSSGVDEIQIEMYRADSGGTAIDSGVPNPNGSLGVPTITTLTSGVIDLSTSAGWEYVDLRGIVTSGVTISANQRVRYRILAEKVGGTTSTKKYEFEVGQEGRSLLKIPKILTLNDLQDVNIVSGTTNDILQLQSNQLWENIPFNELTTGFTDNNTFTGYTATTEQQLDGKLNISGGTLTGDLSFATSATGDSFGLIKQYIPHHALEILGKEAIILNTPAIGNPLWSGYSGSFLTLGEDGIITITSPPTGATSWQETGSTTGLTATIPTDLDLDVIPDSNVVEGTIQWNIGFTNNTNQTATVVLDLTENGGSYGDGITYFVGKGDSTTLVGSAPLANDILSGDTLDIRITSDRTATVNNSLLRVKKVLFGSGGAATWGSITGTLSNQTDLWIELTGKTSLTLFNSYTGTTETRLQRIESDITQSFTGITNLGTGTTIGGTSGQDITFKSISVSGGMTISGDANNIILSSTDPTGSTVAWGSITGTLSNQTDLQNELNNKLNSEVFTGYTASTQINEILLIHTGGTELNTITPTNVSWDNVQISGSSYLWTGGTNIQILETGDYEISYNLPFVGGANSAIQVGTDINVNTDTVINTTSSAGISAKIDGSGSSNLPTVVVTFTANDILVLETFRTAATGTATSLQDGNILIKKKNTLQ